MSRPPSCEYCRRHPVDPAWRPFCSERCKLLDLSRWLDGSYHVPGERVTKDDANDGGGDETKE